MELEFLRSLVLIFGISAAVVFVLDKLKIPSIVGFLISGALLGPHCFGFIKDVHEVELLAEIGVILLMFTIGLEFSLKNLILMRRDILGGGTLQVVLTTTVTFLISFFYLDQKLEVSIFNGFLVALSSTAIVIKLLANRSEIGTPHGRSSLGILIFQDLCVVPFMLLIPILAGSGGSSKNIILTMLKSFALLGVILVGARWAVPFMLHEIVKTRNRELFIITAILLCIGTAFITSKLGLSLALGAFLAGVLISESEYSSQVAVDIMPFKESFISIFFISVGMLMNISFLKDNMLSVVAVVLAVVMIKSLTTSVATLISGKPFRIAIISGLCLSQIGEFSFVLALVGSKAGLLDERNYQIFISTSVITMLLTPFIVKISPLISEHISSLFKPIKIVKKEETTEKDLFPDKSDHVIIVGFGVSGRNLAKTLMESKIPYVVLEMNPNTVKKMKKKGEPIYYGDGTSIETLHKMGISRGRLLVVVISDPAATRKIVQIARHENPRIHIIVRTRYVSEVNDLVKLGANEVISEEFESSIEVFARVLHFYSVPKNVIYEYIDEIRKDHYRALRELELPTQCISEVCEVLKHLETDTYLIRENSSVIGFTIRELQLRTETGATIIAIQRKGKVYQNPSPDFTLHAGDVLLLMGNKREIQKAFEYLESGKLPNEVATLA
ncbi:MAG: monovalent cation:proton antiporter-2 (CPA2) family protein [Thermodesulforhabdaceae bacterium]